MNKRISTACLFLFVCTVLFAQTDKFKSEFSFGVNVGTTLSNVSFVRPQGIIPSQKTFLQYVGGVTARYISEKNFGLQGELNYSQRGWSEEGDDGYLDHQYTYTLGYLEVPLFTHIYFNTGKRGRIVFNLGPQLSFLLNEGISDSHIVYPPGNEPSEGSSDYGMYYNDKKIDRIFDWGLCGGAGFELRTGFGSFILDGRFYYGLSDIFDPSKNESDFYFSKSSNQVISIKLTYLYRK